MIINAASSLNATHTPIEQQLYACKNWNRTCRNWLCRLIWSCRQHQRHRHLPHRRHRRSHALNSTWRRTPTMWRVAMTLILKLIRTIWWCRVAVPWHPTPNCNHHHRRSIKVPTVTMHSCELVCCFCKKQKKTLKTKQISKMKTKRHRQHTNICTKSAKLYPHQMSTQTTNQISQHHYFVLCI